MKARLGDELIVTSTDGGDRVGIVVAINGDDGAPPYVVHWVAGDYHSLISPGSGTRIRARAESGTAHASGSEHATRMAASS